MRFFAAAALAALAAVAAAATPAAGAHANYFIGFMSGHQQVPPAASMGRGRVYGFLNGHTLSLKYSFFGLSTPINTSIGVHIHEGLAGANGPVIFPLDTKFSNGRRAGVGQAQLQLSSEQAAALEARGLYFNLHTNEFAAGELRAQLVPNVRGARLLSASLLTAATNPEVEDTGALGGVVLEIMPSGSLVVSGSFEMLSTPLAVDIAMGAHLHMGITGTNGDVIIPLVTTLAADMKSGKFLAANNTYTPDASFLQALRDREVYVNVHSTKFPSGEIRGQVLSAASSAAFYTNLVGAEEVPDPVMTNATGAVSIEFFTPNIVAVTGSFAGLSSALATEIAMGAHLHRGARGANGPVYQPLKATTSADGRSGRFLLANNQYNIANSSDVASLFAGNTYVNIHSANFMGGEIRGQVELTV
ncbi:hypothetical protein BU14_0294s0010 [Porphyra umbilicalis]|uniref:CHRD domain-containing protein n=1 Tax=Porphyra umbilicalis TaxID=2786 RepID=A0A1X6P0C2_PORUM|nr:hypothetical protein BU14_0294s0010 [Porphyra umbilicalis]|eukprot:OSX74319.1 hypothetical protein BU14_0294s0010 [Porphyra umbilicalis]